MDKNSFLYLKVLGFSSYFKNGIITQILKFAHNVLWNQSIVEIFQNLCFLTNLELEINCQIYCIRNLYLRILLAQFYKFQ
jgi:hypothetical protein